ncbi:uncharacterized protein LOC128922657 [Zeugodacus cucurbitae]|uniref:uncharacterized protein LOC128922657 n=1 Tax=Zeugodacus cucurbitae TaxID=28588 RepID=UPI0023D90E21|nr:uncharacterized protein LOC128922657 [Zeugodacus cucurbitae]
MWTLIAHQRPLVLLMLLLQTCHEFNLHADVGVAASTAVVSSVEAEVSSEHADIYNIRHGRSKVRHSNEKEHLLWALRPQNAPTGNDNAKAAANARGQGEGGRSITANTSQNAADIASSDLIAGDYDNELMSGAAESAAYNLTMRQSRMKAHRELWSIDADSSIQTGNGHLFGSDYWRNSDANGSLISSAEINTAQRVRPTTHSLSEKRSHSVAATAPHSAAKRKHTDKSHMPIDHSQQAPKVTDSPDTGPSGLATTEAPVTHRIRKLHMKKIMESIRNSADKSLGVKASKPHHRSLMTAEQLQGRPMDVELQTGHDSAADDTVILDGGSVDENADSDGIDRSADDNDRVDEDTGEFDSEDQDIESDDGTEDNNAGVNEEDASDESNADDMASNSVDGSEEDSNDILPSDMDGSSDSEVH